jgi:hypothetical protein
LGFGGGGTHFTLLIPALGGLRQKDFEFKASLGYVVRFCLKKSPGKKKKLMYSLSVLVLILSYLEILCHFFCV